MGDPQTPQQGGLKFCAINFRLTSASMMASCMAFSEVILENVSSLLLLASSLSFTLELFLKSNFARAAKENQTD
jgi:hypothetical protein